MILLDSNIVIYAADPAYPDVTRFIEENATAVSAITYVEALGFHKLKEREREVLESYFGSADMLEIDSPVLDRAVALRQRRRMAVGDAVIAATALVHDLPLATNNLKDFRDIPGLQVVRPF